MTDANLVEIFCILDEFCKCFTPELKKHQLFTPEKRHRNRKCRIGKMFRDFHYRLNTIGVLSY